MSCHGRCRPSSGIPGFFPLELRSISLVRPTLSLNTSGYLLSTSASVVRACGSLFISNLDRSGGGLAEFTLPFQHAIVLLLDPR